METMPRYPDCKDKNSFKNGLEFQDFVCAEAAKRYLYLQNMHSKYFQLNYGENLQGFEIKLDRRCTDTGRLSVEIAEKSRADISDYTPSGIYRDDNTWLYIQGNYEVIYVFSKKVLIWLHKSGRYENKEDPTIRAFYLPLSDADKYCDLKIPIDKE